MSRAIGLGLFAAAAVALPSAASASGRAPQTRQRPSAHMAVIGGQLAEPNTLPWMAYTFDARGSEAGTCSGTVVAPNLVLTAAHCAENMETGIANEASGYRVLTGNVNIAAPASEMQVSTVSRVIVCPCFDRRTKVGDVALLELTTPTSAPAVTLAPNPGARTGAVLAGWGDTVYQQQTPVEQLRWAASVVQSRNSCERHAPPFSSGSELCAIDPPARSTGLCNGDSGGPLLMREQSAIGGMVEIGVASRGYDRCATTSPSVFTSAGPIAGWVKAWATALTPGAAGSPLAPADTFAAPKLSGVASSHSLRVGPGGVSLVLGCDREGGVCSGKVQARITVRQELILTRGTTRKVFRRTRKVQLAAASFAIAPGANAKISSSLSTADQALLSRLAGRPLQVTLTGPGVAPRVALLKL